MQNIIAQCLSSLFFLYFLFPQLDDLEFSAYNVIFVEYEKYCF